MHIICMPGARTIRAGLQECYVCRQETCVQVIDSLRTGLSKQETESCDTHTPLAVAMMLLSENLIIRQSLRGMTV